MILSSTFKFYSDNEKIMPISGPERKTKLNPVRGRGLKGETKEKIGKEEKGVDVNKNDFMDSGTILVRK